MSEQMINHVNNWEKANKEQNNESLTTELERYKERVKTFEQRLNIDLSSREKMIDSQMDDMIREKLALKEQIDSLEQNLSKQIKEKESLFKTFIVFKNESKEKENKYMENEINLEKKIKELDNIVYKVGQSAQTVHITSSQPPVIVDVPSKLPKFSVDKKCLEMAKKEILLENDRLLQKIMSQDVLLTVMNSMSLNNDSVNIEMQKCDSCEKCLNLDAELSKSKQAYNDLLKNHSQLEKHCISLEVSMQLKEEVFENDETCVTQNAVEIQEYFEINDLKVRLQDKDTTICKLKDTIKSLTKNTKEENVNHDKCELEPINKELENRKQIIENVVHLPSATTISPGMFKLDLVPLPPRLLQNREVHLNYLRHTQEQADTLREIVEHCSTSNCGSKPLGNKKNDIISQTPSRNKKNKVQAQPRKVNKKNHVVKPVCDVDVMKSLSNANSEIQCATCNKSMFDDVHDKCLIDLVQNGNNRTKSAKKHKKQNVWKPTGHVFTEVGFKWKPTGRIFTIVGNSCPLTSINSTSVVLPKQTTSYSAEIQKPEIKVYSRKPKNVHNIGSSKIAKIVEYNNANHSEPNQTWGSNATTIPSSTVQCFVMKDSGIVPDCKDYGGCGLSAWEVDFCLRRLYSLREGVDLLLGSRDTNLYTIFLMTCFNSSPIVFYPKHQKTEECHGKLLSVISTLGCAFEQMLKTGKAKKSSHQPKAEDTNQEKLYLLHMDLYGLMRVASINRKRYILVIVDDYSRFTWVRFLKIKDKAPAAIIKYIKNIQVRLKAKVRNVRTDNGTEFVNQTLREWYENVGITHQTSVARTPQQNRVVERRNRTLVEVAQTMLIFSKAPLFLWAKAINTACYT
ncbi:retrovirus-related pol polyprotein from transposon TNT 1-94 [Tanacetum coccineum]